MKFYSDAKNQIVVKYGQIIAEFKDGEFETADREIIETLIKGGYKYNEKDHEEQTETVRRDEENNDAGQNGEERLHKAEKVKRKGRPKKGG